LCAPELERPWRWPWRPSQAGSVVSLVISNAWKVCEQTPAVACLEAGDDSFVLAA
jgi:hypothetical protein